MTVPVPHPATEAVVAGRPHPAIKRATDSGYHFWHVRGAFDRPGSVTLLVHAYFDGRRVGSVDFSEYQADMHSQNLEVDPGHRRKGVATAMYVLAEAIVGKPLYDFWKDAGRQSEDAKALWSQPDRPFGRPAG